MAVPVMSKRGMAIPFCMLVMVTLRCLSLATPLNVNGVDDSAAFAVKEGLLPAFMSTKSAMSSVLDRVNSGQRRGDRWRWTGRLGFGQCTG